MAKRYEKIPPIGTSGAMHELKQETEPHFRKCESCGENGEWCAFNTEVGMWICAACAGEE